MFNGSIHSYSLPHKYPKNNRVCYNELYFFLGNGENKFIQKLFFK